jgi:hypothetical protein
MLQSVSVRQVIDFLLFTLGLVVNIVSSIYRSIAELLPASAWMALAAAVFAFLLYARLRSRIEEVEGSLLQLEAKLDSLAARPWRPDDDRERRKGEEQPPG